MRGTSWSRRSKDDDRLAKKLDRLLDRAEDLVDHENFEEAKAVMSSLPPTPWIDPSFHVRAADLLQELSFLDDAERHYRHALSLDSRSSDALHGLGVLHAVRGEYDDMLDAWLATRALDLKEPTPPWAVTEDELTAIAEAAFEEIPAEIREKLSNLPIIVTDYPSEALIREGIDPRTLGLITGVPYAQQFAEQTALDCVQLYQKNIERIATTKEEVAQEIRITVLHETAHYFGLDDDDLDDIGLG
jgi:predicted Zn-dependent protease with MMP-like domain